MIKTDSMQQRMINRRKVVILFFCVQSSNQCYVAASVTSYLFGNSRGSLSSWLNKGLQQQHQHQQRQLRKERKDCCSLPYQHNKYFFPPRRRQRYHHDKSSSSPNLAFVHSFQQIQQRQSNKRPYLIKKKLFIFKSPTSHVILLKGERQKSTLILKDSMIGEQEDDDDDDGIDNLIIPDLTTLLSSISKGPDAGALALALDGQNQIQDSTSSSSSPSSPSSSSPPSPPIVLSFTNNKSKHIHNNNSNENNESILNQLAPAESIAYFYLQNTIGLPSETMFKITNDVGSVLGFTVSNLKTKISFLRRIMDLNDDDVRQVLTKQPSILHLSSNRNVSGKVLFLVRYLDLSKSELRKMVVSYPCILCYSIENLKKKIHFFESVMGFHCGHDGDNELRELLVKYPKLLTAAVDGSFYERIEYLYHDEDEDDENVPEIYGENKIYDGFYENTDFNNNYFEGGEEEVMRQNHPNPNSRRKINTGSGGLIAKFKFLHNEIGIPKDELKQIIQKNPNMMFYSLQENLQPKLISLFIMRLRMDSTHIRKVLKSFPSIIDHNLDNHLLPITCYFLNELEYSPMEFRSIVLKFPKVYSHSLFKVKHVVGYLRYGLGMNALQVKRILFQAPQVISLNTDVTLLSKVEFIRDAFGLALKQHPQVQHDDDDNSVTSNEKHIDGVKNMTKEDDVQVDDSSLRDIRKVISGMPTLLLCSVENNLKPKAEYLFEEFGGDTLELRQAVLTLPTLLGYSLEKRIKPRMERILDAGLEPIKITVGITMKEENFTKWLNNQRSKIQKQSTSLSSLPSDQDEDEDTSYPLNDIEQRSAIVLYKDNEDNESIGSSRIIHWKR